MSHIVYTVDDPVAVIRLDKEEQLNALDPAMLDEMRACVREAEDDRRVVGIVLTGTGRAFCSGWDATALADDVGEGSSYSAVGDGDPTPDLFAYLVKTSKPVLAAVNGVAAAAGFVLSLMADLRFCAAEARFSTTFAKRGLVAEHGSSWMLPRLVGTSKALDLLFTARMVGAEEALRIGLADRVVEGDPVDEASDYIRALARTSSPASLKETKRLVYGHLGNHDQAVRDAWNAMVDSFARPDPTEGISAFVERRDPQFPRLGVG